MSILEFVRSDFDFLMSSGDAGQTETLTLKSPTGQSARLQGIFTDIGASLDPSTGLTVTVGTASVVFSDAELVRAGLGFPVAVPERNSKPWVVTVTRRDGTLASYKIEEPRPDRRVGSRWYILDHYKATT
jgi:hypothetical protein